eukprot:TRINITY_DN12469_c0_g2_i1.p1 TRINITY_DN12469_c0_g2~~TRINITY_DN12469_c0_g2_i1.p1  ORF type:complete len:669 (+),score=109.40 TRINITY_DN12469_c0_g2_i1:2047-4053(+)
MSGKIANSLHVYLMAVFMSHGQAFSPFVLLNESFDNLVLRDAETGPRAQAVWTRQGPPGWGLSGRFEYYAYTLLPDDHGREEYKGWSYVDKNWWIAGSVNDNIRSSREKFTLGSGTILVFDGDEYNNGFVAIAPNKKITGSITTPRLTLPDAEGCETYDITLTMAVSWLPLNEQYFHVGASYNGQNRTLLRFMSSDDDGIPVTPALMNNNVNLSHKVPSNASSYQMYFEAQAGNDWWIALDNVVISVRGEGCPTTTMAQTTLPQTATPIASSAPTQPSASTAAVNLSSPDGSTSFPSSNTTPLTTTGNVSIQHASVAASQARNATLPFSTSAVNVTLSGTQPRGDVARVDGSQGGGDGQSSSSSFPIAPVAAAAGAVVLVVLVLVLWRRRRLDKTQPTEGEASLTINPLFASHIPATSTDAAAGADPLSERSSTTYSQLGAQGRYDRTLSVSSRTHDHYDVLGAARTSPPVAYARAQSQSVGGIDYDVPRRMQTDRQSALREDGVYAAASQPTVQVNSDYAVLRNGSERSRSSSTSTAQYSVLQANRPPQHELYQRLSNHGKPASGRSTYSALNDVKRQPTSDAAGNEAFEQGWLLTAAMAERELEYAVPGRRNESSPAGNESAIPGSRNFTKNHYAVPRAGTGLGSNQYSLPGRGKAGCNTETESSL